jgi:hypothetical protein
MKRLILLAAALACCASLVPAVASAAYLPGNTYRPTSYYSSSYYRPSYSYYGQLNRAGFPRNQYVSPYFRSNGTYVGGYWRNSPYDSYPTCSYIRC